MSTLTSTNGIPVDPRGPSGPAERLLIVRNYTGLSQQAFADALGISLRAEQNYERGSRKIPADLLLTLAVRFGVDPLWVLQGPEPSLRRLDSSQMINHDLLARAVKVVRAAVVHSQRTVSNDDFAYWVVAVYRFFGENPHERGADELVSKLLQGAAR